MEALEQLMDYTFTGQLVVEGLEEHAVLEILNLAHQYKLEKLQQTLCRYLEETLSAFNVCAVYATAQRHRLDHLSEVCRRFMDLHASAILRSESFCQLPADALRQILSRDSFCADELDIFLAVKRWCKRRPEGEDTLNVLNEIRLPLIELNDLLNTVGPSKMIPVERFTRAVSRKLENSNEETKYRGSLVRDVDVATSDHRACPLSPEPIRMIFRPRKQQSILDWDQRILKYNMDEPITIELYENYIINRLVLHLYDREPCSFSFYVEASVDSENWDMVCDYSKRARRSVQRISFQPRVVRFIRIVGTSSTRRDNLFLADIRAFYTDQSSKFAQEENELPDGMCWRNEDFNQRLFTSIRSDNQIHR